jgi:chromosome segregation ATPase
LYPGHGFCNTCIENLFQAGPPPFKCPTCRKRIQRKDAFQIFLNPHQSLTQSSAQSPRRDSDVDIDITLSDDPDSTIERVSSLRKKTREHAAELQRLNKRLQRLQRNLLSANEERDELDEQHQDLQREYDLLHAQHDDLKGICTTHENERRKAERSFSVLQEKYKVTESAEQMWKEKCKTAQRDARDARKEKEELSKGMKELAERTRDFEHRAHRNKVAVSMH